jgi:nicotinate-nucleotide adenylyltransferase
MRVGLLGGCFDPPHRGHLRMASLAQRSLGLDRVLFVPCAHQPLKADAPFASPFHRAAMVALAIQNRPGWLLCNLEMERGTTSYTVETLGELGRAHPEDLFFVIVGSDSLASFPKWKRYRDILAMASVAVVPREPGAGEGPLPGVPAGRLQFLTNRPLAVSSTQIRARLAAGLPIDEFVPAPVEKYVKKHGLYGPDLQKS